MAKMDAAPTTDGEVFFVEIGVLELVRGQVVIIQFGIGLDLPLKRQNARFQPVNLVGGAFQGQAVRNPPSFPGA